MKRRRIPMIPMMRPTRDRIALDMRSAAESMVLAPSSEVATALSRHMAIITASIDYLTTAGEDIGRSPSWRAVKSSLEAMEAAQARVDAGKNWGVTGEEAKTIRAAAAQFDLVLRLIPYNVYEAARIFVDEALAPVTGSTGTGKPELLPSEQRTKQQMP